MANKTLFKSLIGKLIPATERNATKSSLRHTHFRQRINWRSTRQQDV